MIVVVGGVGVGDRPLVEVEIQISSDGIIRRIEYDVTILQTGAGGSFAKCNIEHVLVWSSNSGLNVKIDRRQRKRGKTKACHKQSYAIIT